MAQLYVRDGKTENQIAVQLRISRARVAAILQAAEVPRRPAGKPCPLSAGQLAELVEDGARAGQIAARFGVSFETAQLWLAEAGLSSPTVDVALLTALYVDRELTVREVAAELALSKARVIRELAAAGIERRPRSSRRARGVHAASPTRF